MDEKHLNLLDVQVNIKDIPTDYCWSGYAKTKEEFEKHNFYVWSESEKKNIICSDEIAVSLADYLANYLLKSEVISDMEGIFSPGYDQWFFLAWEQCATCLADFPEWIQGIFAILIDSKIIRTVQYEDITYYLIFDVERIIEEGLSIEINEQIEAVCKKCANEFWKDQYDLEGEVFEPECGEWGTNLYEEFISSHGNVEINAYCSSDNGPGISFGITIPIKDLSVRDDIWIYEGMSDCISENWEEFDEAGESTKEECFKHYAENGIVPESEDEIKDKAKAILEKKLGKYDINFEIDREDIQVNYELSQDDISDAVYSCVVDNFAIAYCVLQDLKNR